MNDRETAVDRPIPNRRTFVKGSAAAAGAALLGTLQPGRYAHAAGSDVLKLGLIGCGGRSTHFQVEMGTSFDHHACVLEYADGKRVYGFGRTAVGCFGSNLDVFHGTKGRCVFQSFAPPHFTDLQGAVTWKAPVEPSKLSPYKQEHVEFFRSLREGHPFQDGQRMATSTLTTMLGQVTAYNGKRVTWEDLMASKFAFPPAGEVRMDVEPPVKPGKDGIYPVAIPGSTKLW